MKQSTQHLTVIFLFLFVAPFPSGAFAIGMYHETVYYKSYCGTIPASGIYVAESWEILANGSIGDVGVRLLNSGTYCHYSVANFWTIDCLGHPGWDGMTVRGVISTGIGPGIDLGEETNFSYYPFDGCPAPSCEDEWDALSQQCGGANNIAVWDPVICQGECLLIQDLNLGPEICY